MAPGSLFEVYLRLRPPLPSSKTQNRFITVDSVDPLEESDLTGDDNVVVTPLPTHVTLDPPTERRRAIETFQFSRVFEEDAEQQDVFVHAQIPSLIRQLLVGGMRGEGTDGLVATLGVTGSGKTHTILGSKREPGMTQMALQLLFASIGQDQIVDASLSPDVEASLQLADKTEGHILSAARFLDSVYTDFMTGQENSRMSHMTSSSHFSDSQTSVNGGHRGWSTPSFPPSYFSPILIDHEDEITTVPVYPQCEYALLVSMYEVYNDRIYDLLANTSNRNHKRGARKELRRRPLLFKSTEASPYQKIVAGLRKVVCASYEEALLVLEAGLHERRVAGTGSNSVSSRSHGFFCVEAMRRNSDFSPSATTATSRKQRGWMGSTLTIVDLAGSERARDAKTQGVTLAETGKINESLMYLGQCLQLQSDANGSQRVPFRQCKLTELLFTNSFPPPNLAETHRRNPQRGIMIITADPHGDFNATAQILRYSALARDVVMPRIPSTFSHAASHVSSTAPSPVPFEGNQTTLSSIYTPTSALATQKQSRASRNRRAIQGAENTNNTNTNNSTVSTTTSSTSTNSSNRFHQSTPQAFASQSAEDRATMELAALEIARLSEDIEILRDDVARESEARITAEAHLLTMEDRMLELEQEIREECALSYEERLATEMARWKANMQREVARGEAHWDRKLEVYERGLEASDVAAYPDDSGDDDDNTYKGQNGDSYRGGGNKENVLIEDLAQENVRLQQEVAVLKRELANRSPSKRKPLHERDDFLVALPTSSEELQTTRSVARLPSQSPTRSPFRGNYQHQHHEADHNSSLASYHHHPSALSSISNNNNSYSSSASSSVNMASLHSQMDDLSLSSSVSTPASRHKKTIAATSTITQKKSKAVLSAMIYDDEIF